jgi:hypothetical protein
MKLKLAITTTTISDEKGVLHFDALAKKSKFEVIFVVAGDKKSKPFDTSKFKNEIIFLDVKQQNQYRCSEIIGWNKVQRRNIAFLEAIKHNPDYILTIDDDNEPHKNYFDKWYSILTKNTLYEVESKNQWFNYLDKTDALIKLFPRGTPISQREHGNWKLKPTSISPKKIGVCQGFTIGDTDIDAMTRITYPQKINSISPAGYCAKDIWSPINSQNTLWAKKMFPIMFVWPSCKRYDDIFGSFLWQKFLFNNNMYVHYGEPISYTDRGKRDPKINLKDEIEGYFECENVWNEIMSFGGKTTDEIFKNLFKSKNPIIVREKKFLKAWLQDLKVVMNYSHK